MPIARTFNVALFIFSLLGPAHAASPPANLSAAEIVRKNTEAKGGLEKIKGLHSLKMIGKFQQGGFNAIIGEERRAPNLVRQTFTIQGMTEISAYDGAQAWKISPFQGRKTAELIGDDDARSLIDSADFYGPLIDSTAKGVEVQYLGHADVDGDDALRLKVKLKNGDILFYYFDPDTYLEIRIETQISIRGTLKESTLDLGSYKKVNGVYLPHSFEMRGKHGSGAGGKITYEKIEADVNLPDGDFKMPAPSDGAAKKN